MRISFSGLTKMDGRSRIEADVVWETAERPATRLHFEVDESETDALTDRVDPFVVAAFVPAMRHGESRLVADSPACPFLIDNLRTAAAYHALWLKSDPIAIEAPTTTVARGASRVASFISGGLDSAFTMRSNLMRIPPGHAARITDGVMVHGFDIGDRPGDDEATLWKRATEQVRATTEDAGVGLVLVRTNVKRELDSDTYFWMHNFHGAGVASVAHALARGFSRAYIASTFDVPHMQPWGSHPITDTLCSSAAMTLSHDGARYSRLEKLKVVADWPATLDTLRICSKDPSGRNCERCEKCLRTMTEFEAIGLLGETETFRTRSITADTLSSLRIRNSFQAACFEELVEPLEQRGRHDLARVIRRRLRRFSAETRARSIAKRILRR